MVIGIVVLAKAFLGMMEVLAEGVASDCCAICLPFLHFPDLFYSPCLIWI
jgi:hypothetical protein